MVLIIYPIRILVRLVLNWKFLEIFSRFCATLSAIGCNSIFVYSYPYFHIPRCSRVIQCAPIQQKSPIFGCQKASYSAKEPYFHNPRCFRVIQCASIQQKSPILFCKKASHSAKEPYIPQNVSDWNGWGYGCDESCNMTRPYAWHNSIIRDMTRS